MNLPTKKKSISIIIVEEKLIAKLKRESHLAVHCLTICTSRYFQIQKVKPNLSRD